MIKIMGQNIVRGNVSNRFNLGGITLGSKVMEERRSTFLMFCNNYILEVIDYNQRAKPKVLRRESVFPQEYGWAPQTGCDLEIEGEVRALIVWGGDLEQLA